MERFLGDDGIIIISCWRTSWESSFALITITSTTGAVSTKTSPSKQSKKSSSEISNKEISLNSSMIVISLGLSSTDLGEIRYHMSMQLDLHSSSFILIGAQKEQEKMKALFRLKRVLSDSHHKQYRFWLSNKNVAIEQQNVIGELYYYIFQSESLKRFFLFFAEGFVGAFFIEKPSSSSSKRFFFGAYLTG